MSKTYRLLLPLQFYGIYSLFPRTLCSSAINFFPHSHLLNLHTIYLLYYLYCRSLYPYRLHVSVLHLFTTSALTFCHALRSSALIALCHGESQAQAVATQNLVELGCCKLKKVYALCENFIYTGPLPVLSLGWGSVLGLAGIAVIHDTLIAPVALYHVILIFQFRLVLLSVPRPSSDP